MKTQRNNMTHKDRSYTGCYTTLTHLIVFIFHYNLLLIIIIWHYYLEMSIEK